MFLSSFITYCKSTQFCMAATFITFLSNVTDVTNVTNVTNKHECWQELARLDNREYPIWETRIHWINSNNSTAKQNSNAIVLYETISRRMDGCLRVMFLIQYQGIYNISLCLQYPWGLVPICNTNSLESIILVVVIIWYLSMGDRGFRSFYNIVIYNTYNSFIIRV